MTEKTTETKAEKFKRMATGRVQRALKTISLIGNLSGNDYEYTPDQVEKIIGALRDAVAGVEARFKKTGKASGAGFSL